MKKLACLLGLLLVVGFSASAQDMNKVDVFGGYSYLHFSPGSGSPSVGMNGVVGSIAYNLTDHVAAVGEFGGNFGSIDGANIHSISYLFGPKIYAHMGKIAPFGQFLLGGVHGSASCSECSNSSANAFAMALGGGLDYNVNMRFSVRLAQFDYVYTHFGTAFADSSSQNSFRYSAGVVIHF